MGLTRQGRRAPAFVLEQMHRATDEIRSSLPRSVIRQFEEIHAEYVYSGAWGNMVHYVDLDASAINLYRHDLLDMADLAIQHAGQMNDE